MYSLILAVILKIVVRWTEKVEKFWFLWKRKTASQLLEQKPMNRLEAPDREHGDDYSSSVLRSFPSIPFQLWESVSYEVFLPGRSRDTLISFCWKQDNWPQMETLCAMSRVIKLRLAYSREILNQSGRNHLLTLLRWSARETLPCSIGD